MAELSDVLETKLSLQSDLLEVNPVMLRVFQQPLFELLPIIHLFIPDSLILFVGKDEFLEFLIIGI
jgi:hypothetical protein